MNEAGPIAAYDEAARGHVLLQPRLYVEILDAAGDPVPEGVRGEVTLTGGFNFCLPLLRYRTGDHAALRFDGRDWILADLEGRPPVTFRTMQGELLNNIEVTHALKGIALTQFALHQKIDGQLQFRAMAGAGELDATRVALLQLFGPGQSLVVESMPVFDGKIVQYTSEIEFEGAQRARAESRTPSI
jgi:phenylacetate-CoA ligase